MRRYYRTMGQHSGIGVLDKAVAILDAAAVDPLALAELVERTGLPRATAHRLAVALEVHRLLSRDDDGRFVLGPRLAELRRDAGDPLLDRGRAGAGLGARQGRRERAAVPARGARPGLHRGGRTRHRAAHHRAGRRPAAADRRLRRPGAVRVGRSRRRSPRLPAGRSSPTGRWPKCAAAAGPSRSASARRASRRCRHRCSPAAADWLAAISISGPDRATGPGAGPAAARRS